MNPPGVETIEQAKRTLIDLSIRYGPRVITAIVIIIAGGFAARRAGQLLHNFLTKRQMEPPVRQLIVRVASLIILLMFLMMALQNLGVELLPLFASLGVAGVGVGLAMQGVLSNLSAGLTIIFTRPFRIEEYISIAGVEGRVETIDLFSTTLSHLDHSHIVIPNRKIVGEILHNYGKIRQLDLAIGVAYAADLEKAFRTLREVLAQNPRVLKEPVPVVGVTILGDSAVKVAVKPWVSVNDYVAATGELNAAIIEAFRKSAIEIPFPQREVRLLSSAAAS